MLYDLLVTPSGFLYVAPATDQFIASLERLSDERAETARRRIGDLATISSVRSIADTTTIPLLAALRRTFGASLPRWDILDIGGFVGTTAIPVERWIMESGLEGSVQVRVFEPSGTADCIGANLTLNDCSTVIGLSRRAVSKAIGKATFVSREGYEISGRIAYTGAADSDIIETTTIDAEVDPNADLLIAKIDTEGHEPEVLAGALRTLEARPMIAAIEYHPWRNDGVIAGISYPEFLFERFRLWDIGNYGYPSRWAPIPHGDIDALKGAATRGGDALTDILCIDRRLDEELVAMALNEARSATAT